MKDILLVGFFSKNESPYMDYYKELIDRQGMSYDTLYFDRYEESWEPGTNEIVFKEFCPTGGRKIKKINIMYRYALFLRHVIKEGDYKGIVVFATVPALMIADILLTKYKGRYLLDIRDYTHEDNKIYYNIEKKLISHAYSVVISSRGFKSFLPKDKEYVVTHNIPHDLTIEHEQGARIDKVRTIGFVGSVRYFQENCMLLEQFKNASDYRIEYYGTMTADCNLQEYCEKNGIMNVSFRGRFNNSEKKSIYKNIDIINSIYGIAGKETTTALPNRLYDACLYCCPIIVSKGTYLEEVVLKYDIGIAVDIYNDDIREMLDDYLEKIDADTFRKNCNMLMEDVKQDMMVYKSSLMSFLNHIEETVN